MGVVIFLLICCILVLIGFCLKWYIEKRDAEDALEVKTERAVDGSVKTEAVIMELYKPFPKCNIPSSNKYSKHYMQSTLKLLLDIQSNPTSYQYFMYSDGCYIDVYYGSHRYLILPEVLLLLKSKNLISIQQTYTPAKHDDYGFVESDRKYEIIIKVTEEGKAYLNS
jgi:hypothetical protein